MPSLLPPFASVADFAQRAGSVTDVARTEAALARASALIRVEANTDWVKDDDGDITIDFGTLRRGMQDAIVEICIAAAQRSLDNPDGVASRTETLDDATISETFVETSSDVYLRAAEKATIRKAAGRGSGLFSIPTTRSEVSRFNDLGVAVDDCGTIYAETDNGAPIPWLQEGQLG